MPTQYQTTTNEEAYASFKETCQKEIGKIMKNHAKSYKESILKRPESTEKQHNVKDLEEKQIPMPELVSGSAAAAGADDG